MLVKYYRKLPRRKVDCTCWMGLRPEVKKWYGLFIIKKYMRVTHIGCFIHSEEYKVGSRIVYSTAEVHKPSAVCGFGDGDHNGYGI